MTKYKQISQAPFLCVHWEVGVWGERHASPLITTTSRHTFEVLMTELDAQDDRGRQQNQQPLFLYVSV